MNEEAEPGWTQETVEERLIEAAALWARTKDRTAHWHKVQAYWPDVHHEYDWWYDYRAEGTDPRRDMVMPRPLPLSREEVTRRDEASDWIEAHVPERDRRLVWTVLAVRAGGSRPDWALIMRRLGLSRGKDGVRMRYSRAVAAVARALERAGTRVAKAAI